MLLATNSEAGDTIKTTLFETIGACVKIEEFKKVAQAGYDYIEPAVRDTLIPFSSDEEFEKVRQQAKINQVQLYALNNFIPGELKSVGPEADHQAILKYAETCFKRASQLGATAIVFGSSDSRNIPKGYPKEKAYQQFVTLIRQMAGIAEKHQMQIWIEPLSYKETNLINTQVEGAHFSEAVNHPAVGIVCDFYHCLRNKENPRDILKAKKHIRHCHIAEKKGRMAPGTHQEDFTKFYQALRDIQYQGALSLECNWDDLHERLPKAITYLQKQIEDSFN